MIFGIHFAQPYVMAVAAVLLLIDLIVYCCFRQTIMYRYSLVSYLQKRQALASLLPTYIIFVVRLLLLLILVVLLGKPQAVDSRFKTTTHGIDIVLALDVSDSMSARAGAHSQESRFEIAKKEALRFIDKRIDDAIGLVIFGLYSYSRCPLTFDKQSLHTIMHDIKIGYPEPLMGQGTVINKALKVALRRLQLSDAKTKIIVLLTDGAPSPHDDVDYQDVVKIAQELGVKIYTIGIGQEQQHQMLAGFAVPFGTINKELLDYYAQKTGGRSFYTSNPAELETIYTKIDALEKHERQMDCHLHYRDISTAFIIVALLLLLVEFICSTFVWFIL